MKTLKWIPSQLILALGLVIAAQSVQADDFRMAVVDMQKALQTVEAGKTAKAKLEKELESKKKEFQVEEANFKKLVEEFKKQQLVMSNEARMKKQQELQERQMKLQEMVQRYQMEIANKEQEFTRPLVNKLREIIAETAKKKNFTVILERNENTVLYHQEKDDITDEVIDQFNKKNKG
jgi:outer membrane protein